MKISVAGAGYVGLSLAVLLAQKHEVYIVDVDRNKVNSINKKQSPISDKEIEDFLKNRNLNLSATFNFTEAYKKSDYVIIATPTNYDIKTGSFDTSSVESVIKDIIKIDENATIVVKSTVPLGFIDKVRKNYKKQDIFFSPEFLRETKALYDNLYPSRIVVGDVTEKAELFGKMLLECSDRDVSEVPLLKMTSSEAEAVKLFSNTFLAMRVSFFNELDCFSEIQNLSTKKIIEGVSSDPRIGNHYNNPSFGYGGYCLPKDTKQLLDNFNNIPNNIIKAVVESNETRKNFIVSSIQKKKPQTVGVYRLVMKEGSDNFRESAIIDILYKLKENNVQIVLYEPFLNKDQFRDVEVISNLNEFISRSDLIIANRFSEELHQVKNKVYTRDLFQEN